MSANDPLDELSGEILEGKSPDWDLAETRSDLDPDAVRALRDVARIADFSHRIQETTPSAESGSPGSSTASQPTPWGNLLLLEVIGTGARGEVWRAWDPTLQREVALKFLQAPGTGADSASLLELLNEARALARVRHRGVVAVYGIAEHDGRPGMWMEHLRGGTLAREMERTGPLPARQVAHIGLELCRALEALEAAGLVHRDIKPANLLLEADGRVVLTDFGLGWRPAIDEKQSPRSSGTPIFMSPEVLAGEKPNHRSDLYALGVTLWWALAGQMPFHARNVHELREEAARGPSQELQSVCPAVPGALVSAIVWAMSPVEADRPKSATHLAERLRLALVELEPVVLTAGEALGREKLQVASIAVLPFVNRGSSAEDEYFSDGLSDELLGVLSKIKGLRVSARASSFHFKDRGVPLADVGKALRVATILDGVVRKSGNRVRISVQLVSVADGFHLWSETYDRTLDDVFAVQDDIAQSVVKELRVALLGQAPDSNASGRAKAEVAEATKGRGTNPEAHRLYLQARYFGERGNRENTVKACGYLKKALELDPAYALAWAHLGRMHMREADMAWVTPETGHGRGRELVERALSLEPDLPEGHAALGWSRMCFDWDWSGADASFRRAQELMPGNTVVLCYAGGMASNLGRLDEAIELCSRAVDQDPLSSLPYISLGLMLSRTGRCAEAEEAFRRALELSPQRVCLRAYLALALFPQGRDDEALALATQEPEGWARLWALAIIHHAAGRRKEGDDALRELIESGAETAAYQIATVNAVRGEPDSAFEWFERAYLLRDTGLAEMKSNPRLRLLHGDPRWAAFLNKMGFENERPS